MSDSNKIIIASWILCLLSSIIIIWTLSLFPLAIPRLETIYRELGIKLPYVTELIIALSHNYLWVIGFLYALVSPLIEHKYSGSISRLFINITICIGALIFQALTLISIFLPLLNIIESFSTQHQ